MSASDPNGTEVAAQSSYIQTRYFEHPLSAATSAMMTANGGANNQTGSEEDSSENNMNNLVTAHQVHNPNGGTTYLYEYYKVPEKETGAIHWR